MNTKDIKIAIIGAGIFGSVAAIKLQECGYQVTIFEKQHDLLLGATENSQNRLHLGLHYPRDLDTAFQSIKGFTSFKNKFQEAVNLGFNNYYALAKNNSQVSRAEFEHFLTITGINTEEAEYEDFEIFGLNSGELAGLWRCEEGVIDFEILREMLRDEIATNGINLRTNCEIVEINTEGNEIDLVNHLGKSERFHYIVRATYGADRIRINVNDMQQRLYEYHHTLILKSETNMPHRGLTIIDGDFLTILPSGKSNKSLLYSPSGSVRDRHIGHEYPQSWDNSSLEEFDTKASQILERFNEWLPNLEIIGEMEMKIAVRSIQPGVKKTDRRTSSLIEVIPNVWDIWSGKIDHCVDISNELTLNIDTKNA
jgi:glycine/D-amino acid oxidase-like deaminating enzyme